MRQFFNNNGVEVLGDAGWDLKRAEEEIRRHYRAQRGQYRYVIYKVVLGINSIITKIFNPRERRHDIVVREVDISYIKRDVNGLFDIGRSRTGVMVSCAQIQGADIMKYYKYKAERKGPFRTRTSKEMQYRVEHRVKEMNKYIDRVNKEDTIRDYRGNKNIGDIVNSGKSKRKSGKKRWSIRYGRLYDGLHTNEDWSLKTARKVIRSIRKEEGKIRERME